jgi:hypothetical protein
MFRKANEPFTWHPVYADSDVCGYWIRSVNVWHDYHTRAEYEAARKQVVGFYQHGQSIRPGVGPTHWTLDPAFEIDARVDPRTGRCALKSA